VSSVCFSPDGTTLISGSGDDSIRLWDIRKGLRMTKLDGHNSFVTSVCFSPDGTTLASGSADNSICLWDAKTGKLMNNLDGHT
jgi:WD40 repeat protein